MELWEIAEHMGAKLYSVLSFVGAGGKTSCVLELAQYWAEQGEKVLVTTSAHMEHPDILGKPGMVDKKADEILAEIQSKGWTIAGKRAKHPEKIQGIPSDVLEYIREKVDKTLIEADGSKRYPVKVPQENEPVIHTETTHIVIVAGAAALGRPLAEVCFRLEEAEKILAQEEKDTEDINTEDKNRNVTVERLGKLLEEGYVKPLRQKYLQKKMAVILNQADQLAEPEKTRQELQKFLSVPVFVHGWNKAVHMIFLAAGFSRRFGENKLVYKINHIPMYQHLLGRLKELLEEGKADSLVVVSQYDEILETVKKQGICAVKNENSARGISSSLQAGLEKTREKLQEGKEQYYMFFAADQPYLQKETIHNFLSAFLKSGKKIGCVSKDGEAMNPVIFHELYVPELMKLQGDKGGKKVLKQHLEEVFFFEVREERELMDCDYKDDIDTQDKCKE